MTAVPRQIDRTNPANALASGDGTIYFNNTPGVWRRTTASFPDSEEIYITSTNQMTHSPSALTTHVAACDGPSKKPSINRNRNTTNAKRGAPAKKAIAFKPLL